MLMTSRVVMVAGAGGGIGQTIAQRFGIEGASVALCDLNLVGLKETLGMMEPTQTSHSVHQLDVRDARAVTLVVRDIVGVHGRIDILVNSVGVTRRSSLLQMPVDEWDLVLDTNLKSAFLLTQAVALDMVERGQGGKIIHIASVSGEIAQAGKAHYCSSKAGLIHFTRCAALELGPYAINVNCVSPGPTDTDEIGRRARADHEYIKRHRIVLGKLARREDIADSALFLASSASDHITGHALVVDGGESVC